MKHMITQEDSMGCGAACVAFAANTTYQQAVSILGQDKARSVGFMLKDLKGALDKYGLRYSSRHIKPRLKHLIYQEGAIVFVRRSAPYPYGHYLIRHDGMWADPWINLVLDNDITNAKSGYRRRLPGDAQWALLPLR